MDMNAIRSQFPGLARDQIFMDNAAGSQVVKTCIKSIENYLSEQNVSPESGYPLSEQATARLQAGYDAAAGYINASIDEIVFGSSTTQLVRNLSTALIFRPGDEIVLSTLDHEAHLAAWVQVARWKGLNIRWWKPSRNTKTNPKLEAYDLEALRLINKKTRLVCFTHTSNVLGSITDVSELSKMIKRINPDTLVSVDGVAYAPHGPIDVQVLGVDFYFFSWYKVYGPHMAMAFIRKSVHGDLDSLGHYFLPKTSASNILGVSGGCFEMIQSIPAIVTYLRSVGWDWIKGQENALQEELLHFIQTRPEIQLRGEPKADRNIRVPVVSFTVSGRPSAEVARSIYATSKCTPTAHNFYARRLFEEVLGIDAENGVIRCSLLHYNTVEEVRNFIQALKLTLDNSDS